MASIDDRGDALGSRFADLLVAVDAHTLGADPFRTNEELDDYLACLSRESTVSVDAFSVPVHGQVEPTNGDLAFVGLDGADRQLIALGQGSRVLGVVFARSRFFPFLFFRLFLASLGQLASLTFGDAAVEHPLAVREATPGAGGVERVSGGLVGCGKADGREDQEDGGTPKGQTGRNSAVFVLHAVLARKPANLRRKLHHAVFCHIRTRGPKKGARRPGFHYFHTMQNALSVQSHSLRMEILPGLAGRVRSLGFRGRELLSTQVINAANWGATYWTSPQSDWGWPPPEALDTAAYEVLTADDAVALRSGVITVGLRRFVVEKYFRPGPHDSTIDTKYVIENRGSETFSMAGWEISRVPAGGLTFFPTGTHEISPIAPHSELPVKKAHGTTFYDHADFEVGKCRKLHADGTEGFLAHVHGDVLILKLFSDSPAERQAPGEGECEIFANDDGKYVEIEVQGSYDELAPGARSEFAVRTAVCELPPGLERENLAGLRAFAEERARTLS